MEEGERGRKLKGEEKRWKKNGENRKTLVVGLVNK
jgi:hypothetical protein